MHDAISDLLLRVDSAIAESRGVASDEDLNALLEMRAIIDARLALPDDILITAVAGGTGSGKSSLVNALAEDELADTGGIRPTTLTPLAVAAPDTAPALSESLASSGVAVAVAANLPSWLVLIDLPDTDSVAVSHGEVVDDVLARVDVVIWVVDPEKYGDASLHHRYLRRWSEYQGQHVYVLNQVDRLPAESRSEVVTDFTRVLVESGVEAPAVITTVASTSGGPPVGIERLMEILRERRDTHPALRKLRTDLRQMATRLSASAGGAVPVDFEQQWEDLKRQISVIVGRGDVARGAHELSLFLEDLGRQMGGASGDQVFAMAARTAEWFEPLSEVSEELDVAGYLDERVGRELREILGARARSGAAIVELVVAVESLSRDLG